MMRLALWLAVLVLLSGCSLPSSQPEPLHDLRQRHDSREEASYGDPSVENPGDTEGWPAAPALRVGLPAARTRWPEVSGPFSLAVATVIDGWLRGSNPEAQERLREAFGARLQDLAELTSADFLPDSVLAVEDLCLAARARRATLLLLYSLDSATGVWSLRLWQTADASDVGVFAGRDAGFLLCSEWEPAGVWADAALLAASGCLGRAPGEEP